jgi:NADH-ubiquinone oxidoreductase chain 4
VSHRLVLLRVWVVFFMILASTFDQVKADNYVKLFLAMLLVLVICFKTNSLIIFYYTFEIALLPIFLIIIGWGYQPERLLARVNLFLYTVFASLPLLLCLLFFSGPMHLMTFTETTKSGFTHVGGPVAGAAITIIIVAGFMVKYPLFSVHL